MVRTKTEFTYGFSEISELTGLSVNAVQAHKSRGNLDPTSLESVVLFAARNGTIALRRRIFDAMLGELPKASQKKRRKR
jgi:hypothetical protein